MCETLILFICRTSFLTKKRMLRVSTYFEAQLLQLMILFVWFRPEKRFQNLEYIDIKDLF